MGLWRYVCARFKQSLRALLALTLAFAPAAACVAFNSLWPLLGYIVVIPICALLPVDWEDDEI